MTFPAKKAMTLILLIKSIFKTICLLSLIVIHSSMILAKSSPIDPIKLEYDKVSHSISFTHIPDYNKLTIFDDSGSIDYFEEIDTISCSFNSQYRLLDELAITGNLTLRVINRAEYLNNEMLGSSRDNKVIFTTGIDTITILFQ